jgi:L-iditol 2-dehydrogenase
MIADLSEQRLNFAKAIGADVYINSQKEDIVGRVLEETNGSGADVVIVACPSPEAQESALKMTKIRGRISFFGGLPHDRSKINFDSNIVHYREISIFGSFASYPFQYKKALSLLASGRIKADKFITHKFPLEEVEKGIKMVKEGKALKAVVVME